MKAKGKAKWSESPQARRERKARAREKLKAEVETFGLTPAQVHAVGLWPGDCLDWMVTAAMLDGIEVNSLGRHLAQMVAQGFLSIERNGRRYGRAALTKDGFSAVILRLRKYLPKVCAANTSYAARATDGGTVTRAKA